MKKCASCGSSGTHVMGCLVYISDGVNSIVTTRPYDWHDSACSFAETEGFDGEPLTVPCDCEMPRLFASAFRDGLEEAKRRLSLVGMHDGKCREPDKPCTCGLDAAIDDPNPVPWYTPEIEP